MEGIGRRNCVCHAIICDRLARITVQGVTIVKVTTVEVHRSVCVVVVVQLVYSRPWGHGYIVSQR